jgi:hypothetical protein
MAASDGAIAPAVAAAVVSGLREGSEAVPRGATCVAEQTRRARGLRPFVCQPIGERGAHAQLSRALELDRVQQDELLTAAGFLPREVSSLLAGEPEITEVLGLLQNDEVPEAYRDSMRQVLRLLAEQAKLVIERRGDGNIPGFAA